MRRQQVTRVLRSAACALAAALVFAVSAAAGEKGTDPALQVQDRLLLWLDAARQPAMRAALGLDPIADGAPLAMWLDGSGHANHVIQRSARAMPRYHVVRKTAFVRFDGEDDCLLRDAAIAAAESLTIILHAAPRANAGGFRAFLATHALGRNDYRTGVTVDQGFAASPRFDSLNVEGHGFEGAVDLMDAAFEPGTFHTLSVVLVPGPRGVKLTVDGTPCAARDRAAGSISLDGITIGARCYSNTSEPPALTGFLDGDLAEVLVYGRALSDEELRSVHGYLAAKHRSLAQASASRSAPLVPIAKPPEVQMLVPGFEVREIGVPLTNINNVRYREDGRLIALGYDGNVWVLGDRDGDGLLETAQPYWTNAGTLRAPIGMALVSARHARGPGVIIAAKGRCVLLADTDHDGRADREVVIAQGWQELPHGVDAVGVALRDDGTVFFGLGAADYTNPYLIDDRGAAHFDLRSERGTVLAVAPDFSSRRVFCTGVRFPVALAFHPDGDLFATDQEGATWLANGNPFDELLHLQEGHHYGFPPRHPRHLPDVIDEPSVFDYGPQHQSTCGLLFDVPLPGGVAFGPSHFAGDAIVTGYSRGKLFRTELARSAAGWVARNHVLACLTHLPVDACISPRGELVLATHSGAPDWGSGPSGNGHLYQVTYADRDVPQPLFAWAASPREVRVAFDRALAPDHAATLGSMVEIVHGAAVRPGDQFESLRPGYEAVRRQLLQPRSQLPVHSVQLVDDRRTLALITAPHAELAPHAIRLRSPIGAPAGAMPQVAEVELAYDLCGVEAAFLARDGSVSWSGWIPHLELAVAREFTSGSASHAALWAALARPGSLTLRTHVDLTGLVRPAVQPGSHLDHEWPEEQVMLVLHTDSASVRSADATVDGPRPASAGVCEWRVRPRVGTAFTLEVEVATGGHDLPRVAVACSSSEDHRPRAVALHRFLLPWAMALQSDEPVDEPPAAANPALAGASFLHGRAVFFGATAMCSRCHTLRGEGVAIGPDLSNLVHRDYDSVLNDILRPSAAIHPDHVTCAITLRDGRQFAGVMRTRSDGTVAIGEPGGKLTIVPAGSVRTAEPVATSIMPAGLDSVLARDDLRDLMAFLLRPAPAPAPIEGGVPPPPRARAEVDRVLSSALASSAVAKPDPLLLVLVAGAKDHGPGEHDYPDWQQRFAELLRLADGVEVQTASGWPDATQLARAHAIVFYSANPEWTAARGKDLDAVLARGGGLVFIHFAVNGQQAVPALADRIGLAWDGASSRYRHGALELDFGAATHPITRGLAPLRLEDESYWSLTGDPARIEVLATCEEEGRLWPLVWTRESGAGRVFVSIPGHYRWTFDDPLFRVLLLRGIAWTARQPIERLAPLAPIGARIATPGLPGS